MIDYNVQAPGYSDSAAPDGRLFAATFPRNNPPLIAALTPYLAGARGAALEVGCGTGQHAAALEAAFPGMAWHPSDPNPQHRRSAAAWRAYLRRPDVAALDLDAAGPWWDLADVRALGPLTAILAMNVVHIAPPAVAQGIVTGAGRVLAPGGLLIFYGPFVEAGRMTGAGNADFDADLKARNPDWGLRDTVWLGDLAADAGLSFAALLAMPANNRVLIFRR